MILLDQVLYKPPVYDDAGFTWRSPADNPCAEHLLPDHSAHESRMTFREKSPQSNLKVLHPPYHLDLDRDCLNSIIEIEEQRVNGCPPSVDVSKTLRSQYQQQNIKWGKLSVEDALNCLSLTTELLLIDHLVCLLQKCRKEKDLRHAERMHAHICQFGLETHRMLGNYLVPVYVECGDVAKAERLFVRLPNRNEFSWSSLIQGYSECGEPQRAFHLYLRMLNDSVQPSRHTFVSMLREAARSKCVERGQKIHTEIAKEGFEGDVYLGSTLVDMYAKCCSFVNAEMVLEELADQNVVSWNALITGYAEHGLGHEALDCLEQLKEMDVSPTPVTYISSVKACGSIGALERGQELHSEIVKRELETDHLIGSTLMDMYARCGFLVDAQDVFDELSLQDTVAWTALITGYAQSGCGEEALKLFRQLALHGPSPDASTFVGSLNACCSIGSVSVGQEIHAEVVKEGYENNVSVSSSLVEMYCKCGLLADGQDVFDELAARDVVSWTALIMGYAEHGFCEQALGCLEQMQMDGISPDAVTFGHGLKACGSMKAIEKGQEIHVEIAKEGLNEDSFVANSLIDMYARCGFLLEAQELFDNGKMCSPNAVVRFAGSGFRNEALGYLSEMHLDAIVADNNALVDSLKACGSLGVIDRGRELHSEIVKVGLDKARNSSRAPIVLSSALIDMYGKCGSMLDACCVFNMMPARDLVSWNGLITGYAHEGESHVVFSLFERMQSEGVRPTAITFLNVLTACNHVGQLTKGQEFFEGMGRSYGITPSVKHLNCMVDLLGRAGQLSEAMAIVKNMHVASDIAIWSTLLSACQKWGDLEVGRNAFESVIRLDKKHSAAFTLMANIYSDADVWREAECIEAMRLSI